MQDRINDPKLSDCINSRNTRESVLNEIFGSEASYKETDELKTEGREQGSTHTSLLSHFSWSD